MAKTYSSKITGRVTGQTVPQFTCPPISPYPLNIQCPPGTEFDQVPTKLPVQGQLFISLTNPVEEVEII